MAENMPPTLEQTRQLQRSLTEKVLDKAASDPQWKQQLIDDSEAAMRTSGFPEIQQLQQMQAGAGAEVRGQRFDFDRGRHGGGDIDIDIEGGGFRGFARSWNCFWWTWSWG